MRTITPGSVAAAVTLANGLLARYVDVADDRREARAFAAAVGEIPATGVDLKVNQLAAAT